MQISKIIEYILSLPKSVYVSFRLFSLKDAVKVPVLVRYNCSLLSLKGNVIICHRGGGKICYAQSGIWNGWNI